MTDLLLADFVTAEDLHNGALESVREGFRVHDALTPYPVVELESLVPQITPYIRVPMALGGFGVALFAFLLETWSAVLAYPFDSGGRPLFSWQVFVLVPFEVGVLAAGIAGLLAFLWQCNLPRLHHALFDVPMLEGATQDRFVLALEDPGDKRRGLLKEMLARVGARSFAEASS